MKGTIYRNALPRGTQVKKKKIGLESQFYMKFSLHLVSKFDFV